MRADLNWMSGFRERINARLKEHKKNMLTIGAQSEKFESDLDATEARLQVMKRVGSFVRHNVVMRISDDMDSRNLAQVHFYFDRWRRGMKEGKSVFSRLCS